MDHYACAILVEQGRLLLGKRAAHRRAYAGCWDVIGGRVEPGETVEAALARELGEELGIVPTAFRAVTSLPDDTQRGPALYHFFLVIAWDGLAAMRNDEHSEIGWFTVDEACALPRLAVAEYPALFRSLELA